MRALKIIKYVILLFPASSYAQTPICYDYDASGNRVARSICVVAQTVVHHHDSSNNTVNADLAALTKADSLIALGQNTSVNSIPEGAIKVFPNPIEEILTVEFSGNEDASLYNLQIFDASSRLFIENNTLQRTTNVNMQQAKPGNYYLVLTNKDGKRLYWKLVKSR